MGRIEFATVMLIDSPSIVVRRFAFYIAFILCAWTVFAQPTNIPTGTNPNDGTGLPLNTVLQRLNANINYIYGIATNRGGAGDMLKADNLSGLASLATSRSNLGAAAQADLTTVSNLSARVTTVYVTDPQFGSVGDYTGTAITSGTGTDNRLTIQAALDAAFTQGPGGVDDYLRNTSHRVVVPKGKYYISAPTNGMPSIKIPLGVEFDFSEAELHFDIPPANYPSNSIVEPNPAWCCILAGPLANIRVGKLQIAAGKDQTYGNTWFGYTLDGIRVQESDVGWIVGGGKERYIYGFFRGAGIRILASYDIHIQNINFGVSGYGIVMGYMGNAFNAYSLYRGGTDPERSSTSLWVDDCVFRNIYRSGIVVGAGGDWHNPNTPTTTLSGLEQFVVDGRTENGGPVSVNHCSFEGCAFGGIIARCPTGSLFVTDTRMEECMECTTALGVVYGFAAGFKVNGFEFHSTGSRTETFGHYDSADTRTNIIPSLLFHSDGVNVSPLLQNLYIANSAISNAKLLTLSSLGRLPTIINYRAGTSSQMQGTDSTVKNIIFPNDGGRIWSVSTVGLTPLETPNGSNIAFSFVNGSTPQMPSRVQIDGLMLNGTNADNSVNWTWGATNITTTTAPLKDVRAFF